MTKAYARQLSISHIFSIENYEDSFLYMKDFKVIRSFLNHCAEFDTLMNEWLHKIKEMSEVVINFIH